MNGTGIVFILVGIFSLAGAGFNWDWFMEHRKARFFTKILGGRERARIFYLVLGVAFLIFGTLGIIGIINLG